LVGAILEAVDLASRNKGGSASFSFGDLAVDEKCELSLGYKEEFLFSSVNVERRTCAGFFGTINCKDYPVCLRSRGNDSVDTATRAVANVTPKFSVGLIGARFSSVPGAQSKDSC
jgi:hypothetical protein